MLNKTVKGKQMKRLVTTSYLAALSIMTGCASNGVASNDSYGQMAVQATAQHSAANRSTVNEAPVWMSKLPKSASAVFASSTSTSRDYAMAVEKATLQALGKICMSAGGTLDKRARTFQTENGDNFTANTEMAIQAKCKEVAVTGVSIDDSKVVDLGNGQFRAYVLVALPFGEANVLRKEQVAEKAQTASLARRDQVFDELEGKSSAQSQVAPVRAGSPENSSKVDYTEFKTADEAKLRAINKASADALKNGSELVVGKTTFKAD